MPKAKRQRVVSLTKTESKGREHKSKVIDEIRSYIDKYDRLFVFTFHNLRSSFLKGLRAEFAKDSRFVIGKNRVMQVALGTTPADEFRDNLSKVSYELSGNVGLLFTNKTQQEVTAYFADYSEVDFARAGAEATETFTVPAGPVQGMAHTMHGRLKRLGLPVELRRGVVVCTRDHDVVTEGKKMDTSQAELLKLFGQKMAEFRLELLAVWEREGEAFTALDEAAAMDDDDSGDEAAAGAGQ